MMPFTPSVISRGSIRGNRAWLARRLPPAPGRLLVGAAGSGREAAALQGLGYDVVALEPSDRAARHCEGRLEPGSTVLRASYRELVAAVLDGTPSRLSLTSNDRFDAVLLGWGSFGHVLRQEQRHRLLEACDVLCPEGPILLSVFLPPVQGRPPRLLETDVAFVTWGGFLAVPDAEELSRHANRLGRELVAALDNSSPYFTLLRRRDDQRPHPPADVLANLSLEREDAPSRARVEKMRGPVRL